jgi:spore coat protein A, manganese oxidase
VDALPTLPRLPSAGHRADPGGGSAAIPFWRVAMTEMRVRVHRDLPPTRMWGYGGTVPGPVLDVKSGEPFLVEWANELPAEHFLPIDHTIHGSGADRPDVRAVVHVHGAKAPPESDGHPESWYLPGRSAVVRYPNGQDAATLWYHDHTMGIERLNQYAGLFGVLLVHDSVEDALALPSGDREVPIVLCDRFFDADGQLHYPSSGDPASPWVDEVLGDAHLVNGKLFPYLVVEPGRYRLRVVNAANGRVYYLSLSNGMPFQQIGSDQGLLAAPVATTTVTLAPAERADLIVDFAPFAGKDIVLRSQTLDLMLLRVRAARAERSSPLPAELRPVPRMPLSTAVKTRALTLETRRDATVGRSVMLLAGRYWHEPVTEKPVLGSTEVWELVNATDEMHPIHLHLVRFQIVDRHPFDADALLARGVMRKVGDPVPPEPNELGWKDTVRADPWMVTRIIVRFDGFTGPYVWHCHVLEHAANEMMRPFEVVAPA